MRILMVAALVMAVGGCKSSKQAPEATAAAPTPAVENKNPYKNVMPDKVKKQVEDIQKKSEDRGDKLLENAK